MSDKKANLGPKELAEFYMPLVSEYAAKLSTIIDQSSNLLSLTVTVNKSTAVERLRVQAAVLTEQFECLKPSIEKLIKRGATILDLADLSPELEIALALRQEELETNFRMVPMILAKIGEVFGLDPIRKMIEGTRVKIVR